ncbi:divalent-cation tolerance protein CutA [Candidatus Dojkabacteria bacterium]|uniref:Divalent-cation tolerance protein CutA n=1 Tax=Candidatus Dojkabacteria bacterium TaxID=2099670 RepID=A0A955L8L3_9BACT|nr:divalent-cation tolerance protein CutA [Candidatus Dojkabacteria bacterium]
MGFLLLYVTAGDYKEAQLIVDTLLEKKLIACGNIVENMKALYWWENAIQRDDEVIIIAKTSRKKFKSVESCVKEIHSYDCPCIIGLPIVEGSQEYLEWIDASVS